MKQSGRRDKRTISLALDQRTCIRRLGLQLQLQLRLRRVDVQSTAICLSLRGCLFGNLDPGDAGVGGCVSALALASIIAAGFFPGRVGRLGGLGGIRGHHRCSILVVHRLYYRIIRLGLLLLGFSLCLRCLAFLLFSFLLLYGREFSARYPDKADRERRTSFSSSRSFASRSFLSFSRSTRSVTTQAAAPSAAASGRDLFFSRSAKRTYVSAIGTIPPRTTSDEKAGAVK